MDEPGAVISVAKGSEPFNASSDIITNGVLSYPLTAWKFWYTPSHSPRVLDQSRKYTSLYHSIDFSLLVRRENWYTYPIYLSIYSYFFIPVSIFENSPKDLSSICVKHNSEVSVQSQTRRQETKIERRRSRDEDRETKIERLRSMVHSKVQPGELCQVDQPMDFWVCKADKMLWSESSLFTVHA